MALTNDASIENLAASLIGRTLPASQWTHEAHFAAALWLLKLDPEKASSDGMREVISLYNLSTGKQNTDTTGYHHTITRASVAAAADQLARHSQDTPLHVVLRDLMRSDLGRSDWLMAFWRRETLFSPLARRLWVVPDLAPLPFEVTL